MSLGTAFGYSIVMTNYERIEKVIKYIEEHRLEQPRLSALAAVAGLSEFHFHRLFSQWAGTTPKAFLKFITNEHAKMLLRDSKDLLSVSLETGLSGPGRLHDLLVSVEGVTPGEFKAKGAGLEIRHGFHQTPFGSALIAVTARGVCHLAFLENAAGRGAALKELKAKWPDADHVESRKSTAPIAGKIFERASRRKLPVLLSGTPFQLKVWEALLRIPAGRASTYGQVAAAIGVPKASRAVGSAIGSNPVAFLIPCHRVIKSAGIVGDYRWGPARKRALLAWESARAAS